jgi:hypothetical protein
MPDGKLFSFLYPSEHKRISPRLAEDLKRLETAVQKLQQTQQTTTPATSSSGSTKTA